MRVAGISAVVTGGASGLGRATAQHLLERGASVLLADVPTSDGEQVAETFGDRARFVAADVLDADQMTAVFDAAGEVRALVHCAGVGGAVRLVECDGSPGSLET